MNKRDYVVLGLMSGTSCDGLDMMLCRIFFDHQWNYEILEFETSPYDSNEVDALKNITNLNAVELMQAHAHWGNVFGEKAKSFLNRFPNVSVDFVSSHGHTVFHQPHNGFTFQMGLGANIAVATRLPVVCDFRTTDVAWGGQGAPLVPIGDALFFGQYDFCINLGGFVNISYAINKERYAFDVCPLNIVLNEFARQLGGAYDEGGNWARSAQVHDVCLQALNALDYYQQPPPKSLGVEWVKENIYPIIERYQLSPNDAMATITEHAAIQLSNALNGWVGQSLLTGGGVFNAYFIDRLKAHTSDMELVIPENKLVHGKEALIFALLGVLRWENNYNALRSVTGAASSSTGGAIYCY